MKIYRIITIIFFIQFYFLLCSNIVNASNNYTDFTSTSLDYSLPVNPALKPKSSMDASLIVYSKSMLDLDMDSLVANKRKISLQRREVLKIVEKSKDTNGIALDLGSWERNSSLLLSKHFKHVVTIDPDQYSLQDLKDQLKKSKSSNVFICSRPVRKTSEYISFNSECRDLEKCKNELSDVSSSPVKSITFKQVIHDFVYMNDTIQNKKISFIKCDILGEEENILEDILYFAYYNKTKVCVSFYLDTWKKEKIDNFGYLFKFFKTNYPNIDIVTYLQQNPEATILFEPLTTQEDIIKKNTPVVIIGYNLYSYIKNMVTQLEKYTSDIIIVDNNSNYGPLLDYYANDFKYTLLRQKTNYGHRVYEKHFVQNLVGNLYILTDPDLQFNEKLPDNFIETLIDISYTFKAHKVGFALCIADDLIDPNLRSVQKKNGELSSVSEWEKQFWEKRLIYPMDATLEMYHAMIDTTFCLINKKFIKGFDIRMAGDYTCLHIPWLKNCKNYLMPGEYEAYLKNNISTTWCKKT